MITYFVGEYQLTACRMTNHRALMSHIIRIRSVTKAIDRNGAK